jgi:hypothetical protein
MVNLETVSIVLTGMGLMIALTYYGLQIRNQNRARQAQLFMQMYGMWRDYSSGLDFFPVISTKISGIEEYQEKLESDENFVKVYHSLCSWYEGMGVLVKANYLDIRLVALMWAGVTRMFWENLLEPVISDLRELRGLPRLWSEAEYVCRELVKHLDEHPELKT